jgi:protein ImuA
VILEPWGDPKALDLTASRRIALACARSGVPALLLRSGGAAGPSAARTRWILRAAASGPSEAWGAPLFDASLARNRSGRTGRWTMEWSRDAGLFRDPARDSFPETRPAHPRPALPPAADRPLCCAGSAAARRMSGPRTTTPW